MDTSSRGESRTAPRATLPGSRDRERDLRDVHPELPVAFELRLVEELIYEGGMVRKRGCRALYSSTSAGSSPVTEAFR